jgi:hypothetical protein
MAEAGPSIATYEPAEVGLSQAALDRLLPYTHSPSSMAIGCRTAVSLIITGVCHAQTAQYCRVPLERHRLWSAPCSAAA